jgi:outer membrane protein
MKNKTTLLSGILMFSFAMILNLAINQDALTQQARFGFVNSGVIMTQFEEAQRAQRQFENIVIGWENELRQKISDLQEKYDDFQRKQGMMTEQARVQEQQSLVELEQEINQYRMEKFGQGGEVVTEQDRIFRPVREKIINAIDAIAKQETLSFVFDKTDEMPVLLYAESRFDVTFKVLDYLKRGSQ